ncbi:MAG: tripartite tricarboxylate transporter substrate binding protein [Pigmentiphaga sp.]
MFTHSKTLGALLMAALPFLALPSHAQSSKPLHIVLGFPAGGPTDNVARPLAEQLSAELKRTVIVENRPGANGNIAASHVARSPADGSVLFFSTVGAIAISPSLYSQLPYDPNKDFKPVSLLVDNSSILVVNVDNPASTAAEFVQNSQRDKRPTPFSSSGVGSIPHMALELFSDASQAKLTHIPYKGAAPAIVDIIGGHVSGFFADAPAVMAHLRGKRLKALGVAGPHRLPVLPDVPTFEEQGISGVASNNWYGLFAPAATPPEVIESLSQAVARVIAVPELREKLIALGTVPVGSTPDVLAQTIERDTTKWAHIIKDKNITAE